MGERNLQVFCKGPKPDPSPLPHHRGCHSPSLSPKSQGILVSTGLSLQGPRPCMLSALELAWQVTSWTCDGDTSLLPGQRGGEGPREPGSGCCRSSTIDASKSIFTPVHSLTALVPEPWAGLAVHKGVHTGSDTSFLLS